MVSKSHESRASGGRLCCDVGNDHLGVDALEMSLEGGGPVGGL